MYGGFGIVHQRVPEIAWTETVVCTAAVSGTEAVVENETVGEACT